MEGKTNPENDVHNYEYSEPGESAADCMREPAAQKSGDIHYD